MARELDRLNEHLASVLKEKPNLDWFVICLQGSQNYGMADEHSDIDSKLLVLPSLGELVLNHAPHNYVHIMENEEHVDVKDVREYFKIMRKQNVNFMEIIFTDYWIVNEKYQDLWLSIRANAEKIARSNEYRFLKCCKGMCLEKQHALCHPYPSKMDLINTYGWDGKQLSHAMRIYNFALRFVSKKEDYKSCLVPENLEFLQDVKRNRWPSTVDHAVDSMEQVCEAMSALEVKYNQYRKDELDADIDQFLNDILYELICRSLYNELKMLEKEGFFKEAK